MSKPITDSKGRPVVDLEWAGSGVDSYLACAHYDDTPDGAPTEEVPENELEWIGNKYADLGYEASFERSIMRAEAAWDAARGH